jgi:host factor-I protein
MEIPRSPPLQDRFFEALREADVAVSLYLVSGIRVSGHIESFDQFVIGLKGKVHQTIYKRAIATIVPERDIRLRGS